MSLTRSVFQSSLLRKVKHHGLYLIFVFLLGLMTFKMCFHAGERLRDNKIDGESKLSPGRIKLAKLKARLKYSTVRKSVQEYCEASPYSPDPARLMLHNLTSKAYEHKWRHKLWNSPEFGFSACFMGKVGSTTWTNHFLRLVGVNRTEFKTYINGSATPLKTRNPEMRLKYFPPGEGNSLKDLSRKQFTFVFVRHPFHRLVSAYREKMCHDVKDTFKDIRDAILKKYRPHTKLNNSSTKFIHLPTPTEFVRYIVDEAKKDIESLNNHFKPQYLLCPHCSVPFDAIGKIETMEQDSMFIMETLGIKTLLNPHLHANNGQKRDNCVGSTAEFFGMLDSYLTNKIYGVYRSDFIMFGYEKENIENVTPKKKKWAKN